MRRLVSAVYLVAFAVRFAWVLLVQSPRGAVYSDMAGYVGRAEALVWGPPLVDPRMEAFYPFGTHWLIAGELAIFGRDSAVGVAFVHALVGAIPPACVVWLVARLDRARSRSLAVAAGLFAALWPPQIVYAGYFLSEIWFTAAVLLATALAANVFDTAHARAQRWPAVCAGIAAAAAIVIRPQVILTIAIAGALFVLAPRRRARLRRHARSLALLAAPIALTLMLSSARFHAYTGRWGLVSENAALMRLFGETDVAVVSSAWFAPSGAFVGGWFGAGLKQPHGPHNTFDYTGYLGDPEILDRERHARLVGVPWTARFDRAAGNLFALVLDNEPFPEAQVGTVAWRRSLGRQSRRALTFVLLPLALLGGLVVLRGRRRTRAAGALVFANLATLVSLPAVFYMEARYRVPYDPFVIALAFVGVGACIRRLKNTKAPDARGAEGLRSNSSADQKNVVG